MAEATATKGRDMSRPETLDPGLNKGFVGPKVRVLWNLLSARMVAALEPFGLRIGAFSTLAMIAANPGCSQTELARGLGLDKSAVVAIIDELEKRGLAKRVRSAQDRRRHALSITAKGEALMHRMFKPVSKVGLPIREELSPKEMEQLLSLLDRAYQALAQSE
jgi:DNA-binding MarR family transcriptional regulator